MPSREEEQAAARAEKESTRHGVFLWSKEGRYPQEKAVSVHKHKGHAERAAAKRNEAEKRSGHGEDGYVVRSFRVKPETRSEALGRRIDDLLPEMSTDEAAQGLYAGEPVDRKYSSGSQAKVGDRVKKKLALAGKKEAEVHGVLFHDPHRGVRVRVTGGRNIAGGAPVGQHYDPTGWQRHTDD
jgi:hypothetical protein